MRDRNERQCDYDPSNDLSLWGSRRKLYDDCVACYKYMRQRIDEPIRAISESARLLRMTWWHRVLGRLPAQLSAESEPEIPSAEPNSFHMRGHNFVGVTFSERDPAWVHSDSRDTPLCTNIHKYKSPNLL